MWKTYYHDYTLSGFRQAGMNLIYFLKKPRHTHTHITMNEVFFSLKYNKYWIKNHKCNESQNITWYPWERSSSCVGVESLNYLTMYVCFLLWSMYSNWQCIC